MPELFPKSAPHRSGDEAISAKALNRIREAVPRTISGDGVQVKRFDDRFIIENTQAHVREVDELKTFVVIEEFDDYLTCVSFDFFRELQEYDSDLGESRLADRIYGAMVYVAKPEWLQKSPYDGKTVNQYGTDYEYIYTTVGHRTANSAAQSISPSYYPGAIITAKNMMTGYEYSISGSFFPIDWSDINTAGRNWQGLKLDGDEGVGIAYGQITGQTVSLYGLTTLSATLEEDDEIISVTNIVTIPVGIPTLIQIDNEEIVVLYWTGSTVPILCRGANGTVAASHTNGTLIKRKRVIYGKGFVKMQGAVEQPDMNWDMVDTCEVTPVLNPCGPIPDDSIVEVFRDNYSGKLMVQPLCMSDNIPDGSGSGSGSGSGNCACADIDVLFAIDTTATMVDAIARITQAMTQITIDLGDSPTCKFGVIAFKDLNAACPGDDYLYNLVQPITDDLAAVETALQSLVASGGCDGPESHLNAIEYAANNWTGAIGGSVDMARKRVIFVISDAPPHVCTDPGAYWPCPSDVQDLLFLGNIYLYGLDFGTMNATSVIEGMSVATGGGYLTDMESFSGSELGAVICQSLSTVGESPGGDTDTFCCPDNPIPNYLAWRIENIDNCDCLDGLTGLMTISEGVWRILGNVGPWLAATNCDPYALGGFMYCGDTDSFVLVFGCPSNENQWLPNLSVSSQCDPLEIVFEMDSPGGASCCAGSIRFIVTAISGPPVSVTPDDGNICDDATTWTINGTGFNDVTPGNNIVTFNRGAIGTCTAATLTSISGTFSTLPTSLGVLTAIVSNDNGTSGSAVQVDTVVDCSTTPCACDPLPSTLTATVIGSSGSCTAEYVGVVTTLYYNISANAWLGTAVTATHSFDIVLFCEDGNYNLSLGDGFDQDLTINDCSPLSMTATDSPAGVICSGTVTWEIT